jgi:hypothetical protein
MTAPYQSRISHLSCSTTGGRRYKLTIANVTEDFQKLCPRSISELKSRPTINLENIGFGDLTSGRFKSQRIVVQIPFRGHSLYPETTKSHFISALAAIVLVGDVLNLKFIRK